MADSNGSTRDSKGRFREGNPGGPGNPRVRRLGSYRRTISEAITPADVRVVIRKLVERAKEGELVAIRELLDRVVGRPPQASSYIAGTGMDLGKLRTAQDVARASEQLGRAVSDGVISPEDAARVGLVLELVRKAIETGKLEEELRKLQESIDSES